MRVLHVTECYSGGVARAIKARIAATPQLEHHLLWAGDEQPELEDGWSSLTFMPSGHISRVLHTNQFIRTLDPGLVHAHSSWAGVYSRVLPTSNPIVYEPHCFKFDDPELRRTERFVFRFAEKLLASRTAAMGVLSHHEQKLALSLRPDLSTVLLPNVPTIRRRQPPEGSDLPSRAVMVGRIARQKDPEFFISVIRKLRRSTPGLTATWIGDGEPSLRQLLTDEGIDVTGWVGPTELSSLLSDAIYIHTASYEGLPLSLLDAAAAGAIIVVRNIPPLAELDLPSGETPAEVAARVNEIFHDRATVAQTRANNVRLMRAYSRSQLKERLNELYSEVAQKTAQTNVH